MKQLTDQERKFKELILEVEKTKTSQTLDDTAYLISHEKLNDIMYEILPEYRYSFKNCKLDDEGDIICIVYFYEFVQKISPDLYRRSLLMFYIHPITGEKTITCKVFER